MTIKPPFCSKKLDPFYDTVQSIYDNDHTTDWLKLFLDPTLLYSCAYFERPEMTLEEAQLAKLDLSLGKCELQPGHTLLEIGCGWGACSYRAAEKFQANVIGLTLSETQRDFCTQKMKGLPAGSEHVEIRLQGWEEFEEPVDRSPNAPYSYRHSSDCRGDQRTGVRHRHPVRQLIVLWFPGGFHPILAPVNYFNILANYDFGIEFGPSRYHDGLGDSKILLEPTNDARHLFRFFSAFGSH